jgi:osomolarity two-component system sensor histidine kinase SLN1
MRSIFGPLKLDANARGLELETSLDCRIDEVATKAAYQESDCQIIGEGSGIVMGDEMRLRQVINNRASRPLSRHVPY